MDLQNFHRLVGETIMFCQCIERDIKYIYSEIVKGDFNKNYDMVAERSLGSVLKKLKEQDNRDKHTYFTAKDYETLDTIRGIRNYWAHQAYTEFVYLIGQDFDIEYSRCYSRLINDHNRLLKLSKIIEDVRLEVVKKGCI